MINVDEIYEKVPTFLKAGYPDKYQAVLEYISANGIDAVNDNLYESVLTCLLIHHACNNVELSELLHKIVMFSDKASPCYRWMSQCVSRNAVDVIIDVVLHYTNKESWTFLYEPGSYPTGHTEAIRKLLRDTKTRWAPNIKSEDVQKIIKFY